MGDAICVAYRRATVAGLFPRRWPSRIPGRRASAHAGDIPKGRMLMNGSKADRLFHAPHPGTSRRALLAGFAATALGAVLTRFVQDAAAKQRKHAKPKKKKKRGTRQNASPTAPPAPPVSPLPGAVTHLDATCPN